MSFFAWPSATEGNFVLRALLVNAAEISRARSHR